MRVSVLICEPPPDLRLTSEEVLRPQWIQSAVPSVVRLTEDGEAVTVPLRLPALAMLAKSNPTAEASKPLVMARMSQLLLVRIELSDVFMAAVLKTGGHFPFELSPGRL